MDPFPTRRLSSLPVYPYDEDTRKAVPISQVRQDLAMFATRHKDLLDQTKTPDTPGLDHMLPTDLPYEIAKERFAHVVDGLRLAIGKRLQPILPFLEHILGRAKSTHTLDSEIFVAHVQKQVQHELLVNVLSEHEFLTHILYRQLLKSKELMEQIFGDVYMEYMKQYDAQSLAKYAQKLVVEHNTKEVRYEMLPVVRELLMETGVTATLDVPVHELRGFLESGMLGGQLELSDHELALLQQELIQAERFEDQVQKIGSYSQEKMFQDVLAKIMRERPVALHEDPHGVKSVFAHMAKLLDHFSLTDTEEDYDHVFGLFEHVIHHTKYLGFREQNLLTLLNTTLESLTEILQQFQGRNDLEIECTLRFDPSENLDDLLHLSVHLEVWKDGRPVEIPGRANGEVSASRALFSTMLEERNTRRTAYVAGLEQQMRSKS